jgi:predicted RNA-binding protein with PUA-like domain
LANSEPEPRREFARKLLLAPRPFVLCSLFVALSLTMERMSYFLFKTEPDVYSFDDFLRDQETIWDGVTNPTAVKYLREMKAGTKWIFYHTGDERTAVGTGTVVSVDATNPKIPIVKVKAGKRLRHPKTLAVIKAEPLFAESPLVVIGRLSVVPLTVEQWEWFVG